MPLSGDSRDRPWPFAQEVYDRSKTQGTAYWPHGDSESDQCGVTGSA